jgi:hypothetical protein
MKVKTSLRVFLLLYENSYFFTHIRRTPGKCLNVHREYGEFRVVCGAQSRLRICGRNLCVHGEDARRHKTVYISVHYNKNFKFFKILSIYTIWDGLSLKTISRYCHFKSIFHCQMILKTKLDDIKKAVVVGGPIPQVLKH